MSRSGLSPRGCGAAKHEMLIGQHLAFPKLGPNFPECDRGEFADAIGRQTVALIDVLAVPSAGAIRQSASFPTMSIKGIVELGARSIVSEPCAGTDMIAEFAAEIVIKAALGEAGKKLAR